MSTRRTRRLLATAGLILAPVLAGACADEDGDGATTDEEIQDLRDETEDAEERIETEIEGQNTGSDENDSTTTSGG